MQRLPNWFCGLLRAMARHPSATGFFLFFLLISRRVRPLRSLDFNHRTAARWKMHLVPTGTARICRGSTKTYIISLRTLLISPFGNFRWQPFPTLRQHPLSFFFILTQLCDPLAETFRLFFFFFVFLSWSDARLRHPHNGNGEQSAPVRQSLKRNAAKEKNGEGRKKREKISNWALDRRAVSGFPFLCVLLCEKNEGYLTDKRQATLAR